MGWYQRRVHGVLDLWNKESKRSKLWIRKKRKVHRRLNASWKICFLAVNGQSFLVIFGKHLVNVWKNTILSDVLRISDTVEVLTPLIEGAILECEALGALSVPAVVTPAAQNISNIAEEV